jgi:hypothetical protein
MLAEISETNAKTESLKRMRIADELYTVFKQDVPALREEYAHVLGQSGVEAKRIATLLTECEHEATAADLSFPRQLARRITQINPERATDLIRSKQIST